MQLSLFVGMDPSVPLPSSINNTIADVLFEHCFSAEAAMCQRLLRVSQAMAEFHGSSRPLVSRTDLFPVTVSNSIP